MKDTIVQFLQNNPNQTANNIAKTGLGYNKATNAVRRNIQEMVNSGQLTEDNSGRYTTYSLASGTSTGSTSGTVSISNDAPKNTVEEVVTATLPSVTMPGFSYELDEKNMVVITETKTGKQYPLNADEYLIVINGNVEFAATTPADALGAIAQYSSKHGMSTYVVSDLKSGKAIASEEDVKVDSTKILSLKIQKHNKAAA